MKVLVDLLDGDEVVQIHAVLLEVVDAIIVGVQTETREEVLKGLTEIRNSILKKKPRHDA